MKFNEDALKIWKYWIIERNRIYFKKSVLNLPSPWTKDPIFQTYKFTNVKRWQDRETCWLLDNIVNNSSLSLEDKVYNCILFRLWNKGVTFERICGKGITTKDLRETSIEVFEERINKYKRLDPNYAWYTSAFFTSGLKQTYRKYSDNVPLRMIFLIKKAIENNIYEKIQKCSLSSEVYSVLSSIKGIANFLAYQIYVDLTYIEDFPFTEEDFVVAGPGCQAGEDILFSERTGTYEDALFYLVREQDNIFGEGVLEEEFKYLPSSKRRLTVMDIENSMCELSKYWRTYTNTGRPKCRYGIK